MIDFNNLNENTEKRVLINSSGFLKVAMRKKLSIILHYNLAHPQNFKKEEKD